MHGMSACAPADIGDWPCNVTRHPQPPSMLEGINQLIKLGQDFPDLGARGRVRERQTQVHHAVNVVGAAIGNSADSKLKERNFAVSGAAR